MKIKHFHHGDSRALHRAGVLLGVLLLGVLLLPGSGFGHESVGPDWDEGSKGTGDAGNTTNSAQKVVLNIATLSRITGSLDGEGSLAGGNSDFQDVYEVVIANPGMFMISTLPPNGGSNFNTLLCVYDYLGKAMLANDDADQGVGGASRIGTQSTDGTFTIQDPGSIFISISGDQSRPTTSNGDQVFAFTQNPADVVGPTPAGMQQPMDAWDGQGEIGQYVIELQAVVPFPTECGAEFTGSCGQVHARPFCGNTPCCEAVCSVDSFCCEVTWDAVCVGEANYFCNSGEGGCGEAANGSCFEPHKNPYCDDPACCAIICVELPFCCNISWDAVCASVALETCGDPCGGFCLGDLNDDAVVDGADLAFMLGSWSQGGCADLDGNGIVNGADLTLLLGSWGSCDV